MVREEAIEVLRRLPIWGMGLSYERKGKLIDALNIALAALRGPTREQVEKMRGEVNRVDKFLYACSKCGSFVNSGDDFCCRCGAPMTDEAVDIVMQRLEAIKDAAD